MRHVGKNDPPRTATSRERQRTPRKTIATGFMLAAAAGWAVDAIPSLVLIAYVAMSLLAFLVYASDKSAASNQRWRTPESTLHLLGLLGGWPGALLAQDVLRHKSSKQAFQLVFWATVLLNLVAVGWMVGNGTAQALDRSIFAR